MDNIILMIPKLRTDMPYQIVQIKIRLLLEDLQCLPFNRHLLEVKLYSKATCCIDDDNTVVSIL